MRFKRGRSLSEDGTGAVGLLSYLALFLVSIVAASELEHNSSVQLVPLETDVKKIGDLDNIQVYSSFHFPLHDPQ